MAGRHLWRKDPLSNPGNAGETGNSDAIGFRRFEARAGISLVEIVVAMTLMSAVLIPVAGLTALGANRSVRNAGATYRQGILNQEVNRLTSVPFGALPGAAGCTTVATGAFPHTLCVTVTDVTGTLRRVRVVVAPSQPGVRPDSSTFERANPPVGNPLSTS
jgi:Tfp pilus assembly protein PilV